MELKLEALGDYKPLWETQIVSPQNFIKDPSVSFLGNEDAVLK